MILVSKGILRLSIFLLSGIILVCLEKTRNIIRKIIMGMPGILFFLPQLFKEKISARVAVPLAKILDNFALGFNALKSPKRIWICAGLSLCVWVCQAASFYVLHLVPRNRYIVHGNGRCSDSCVFFIALPSVPGYWGVWEAGGVFALSLFGISPKDAAGFTLANMPCHCFRHNCRLVSAMVTGVGSRGIFQKEKAGVSGLIG